MTRVRTVATNKPKMTATAIGPPPSRTLRTDNPLPSFKVERNTDSHRNEPQDRGDCGKDHGTKSCVACADQRLFNIEATLSKLLNVVEEDDGIIDDDTREQKSRQGPSS